MNAEIETYLDQLLSIMQDVPGIVAGLSDSQFNWRPAANRWSIAECLDHLNTTAGVFVPLLDLAIQDARARGLAAKGPFAYPLIERFFLTAMEPPPRIRFRTPPALAPATPIKTVHAVVGEFMDWQDKIGERLRWADGLDLRRIRVRSPAVRWVRYSLGTGFGMTLAHERRHIWQARQTRKELDRLTGSAGVRVGEAARGR